ncbi:hypothetical protein Tco_0264808 [Tanacetum coccineum]
MSIEEIISEKRLIDDEIKDIMNDLSYKRFQGEKIDDEYERDCEIKIKQILQDYNGLDIEMRKKERDDSIPLRDIIARYSPSVAIISSPPVLPTREPEDSLIMGDGHLDTILETESDKVIKSSVENLVPIPRESEGVSDDTCDVPFCVNSPLLDVINDHFEIFSDSNNDYTLSDNDSFEDIDYIEASPPEDFLIMGNEELSTIPKKESNEFIKSSVEDLIPIPRESEDTSGSDSESVLPLSDDFSPNFEEKSVTFSNSLFDSNDFTSSDNEPLSDEVVSEDVKIYSNPLFEFDDEYISSDVNPLFDEVLEDIECEDSYDSNLDESTFLVTPLSDSNEDGFFTPRDNIELLLHLDPSISIVSILEGTILEKESDEFIKSNVEDLIPIPRESEDTSGSDSKSVLPSSNDFSPIFEEKSVTFSNPLFDSNDFTSSDNELLSDEDVPEDVKIYSNSLFEFDDEYISSDVNPLFDEVLEDIECKDSYDSNLDESTFLVTPLSDANEDECFDPGGVIDEIDAFLDMDISTDIENGYHDSEGDIIYLESLLIDDTSLNLPPEVFLDHDPRSLKDEPDNDDLMTEDKVFDPGIYEKSFSLTFVKLTFEDRHYFPITFVIRIFLPYLTYSVDSSFLLSSGSEDTIFDPGISTFHFSSLKPVAYENPIFYSSVFAPRTKEFEENQARDSHKNKRFLGGNPCLFFLSIFLINKIVCDFIA